MTGPRSTDVDVLETRLPVVSRSLELGVPVDLGSTEESKSFFSTSTICSLLYVPVSFLWEWGSLSIATYDCAKTEAQGFGLEWNLLTAGGVGTS